MNGPPVRRNADSIISFATMNTVPCHVRWRCCGLQGQRAFFSFHHRSLFRNRTLPWFHCCAQEVRGGVALWERIVSTVTHTAIIRHSSCASMATTDCCAMVMFSSCENTKKKTLLQEKLVEGSNRTSSSMISSSSRNDLDDDDEVDQGRWQAWQRHWWKQLRSIPNCISLARMGATPLLAYWIVTNEPVYALAGCSVAALSDWLDGWIAKQCNMETVLGTYLDPLADKVTINGLSIAIWYNGVLPTPIVAIWMAKDIALMVATYEYVVTLSSRNREDNGGENSKPLRYWTSVFGTKRQRMDLLEKLDPLTVPLKVVPTRTSKFNTALQFVVLGMSIVHPLYNLDPYLCYLGWTTTGTTVLALCSYVGYRGLTESDAIDKRK